MNGEITRRESAPGPLGRARGRPLERRRAAARGGARALSAERCPRRRAAGGACGTDCPPPDSVWWARFGAETGSIAEGRPVPCSTSGRPKVPGASSSTGGVRRRSRASPSWSRAVNPCLRSAPMRHAGPPSPPPRPTRDASAPRCPGSPAPLRRPGSGRALGFIRPPARGGRSDPRRLERDCAPAPSPSRFQHVVLIDPPPSEAAESLATQGRASGEGFAAASAAGGYLHVAFGPPGARVLRAPARPRLGAPRRDREIWRGLAAAGGEAEGAALRSLLAGGPRYERTPRSPPGAVAVSTSLAFVNGGQMPPPGPYGFILGEDRSGAIAGLRACLARHQEAIRFLRSRAQA